MSVEGQNPFSQKQNKKLFFNDSKTFNQVASAKNRCHLFNLYNFFLLVFFYRRFTDNTASLSKMVHKTLEGYDQFKEFYGSISNNETVNFYFTGNKDENGVSWCPDCVVGKQKSIKKL